MKIFALKPSESWICDRFVEEWKTNFPSLNVDNPEEADIIWLLADWCWDQISPVLLSQKKVVATVHHIVPEKFDEKEKRNFLTRDRVIDCYHVPCKKTHDQIRDLTDKPIHTFPFWVNQTIWKKNKEDKSETRKKFGINEESFLIGSFQRDTEGSDLISPKLEKGPDLLFDAIKKLSEIKEEKVEVLLAGWRRQYIIQMLEEANIKYYYFELPKLETINDFYNCLDLYIVSARYEGGPQSIVECALVQTPIVSTDVGLASEILSEKSIFKPGSIDLAEPDTEYALDTVSKIMMPRGFFPFMKMLQDLNK